jgi:hypothetical protein
MRRLPPLLPPVLAFAFLTPSQALLAGEISPAAVTFAPKYEATFKRTYGADQMPVLRSEIVDLVSRSLKSAGSRCSRELDVTVERVAPTYPTMKQQLDNPTLSAFSTVYRDSGASLTGHVLDSSGHVLATVKYEDFNGYQPGLSPARDPWSEARVAIDAFSHRLVDACVRQSVSSQSS